MNRPARSTRDCRNRSSPAASHHETRLGIRCRPPPCRVMASGPQQEGAMAGERNLRRGPLTKAAVSSPSIAENQLTRPIERILCDRPIIQAVRQFPFGRKPIFPVSPILPACAAATTRRPTAGSDRSSEPLMWARAPVSLRRSRTSPPSLGNIRYFWSCRLYGTRGFWPLRNRGQTSGNRLT